MEGTHTHSHRERKKKTINLEEQMKIVYREEIIKVYKCACVCVWHTLHNSNPCVTVMKTQKQKHNLYFFTQVKEQSCNNKKKSL